MGLGTDLAREHAPEHAQIIDDFKEQLLLVLIKRLGGKVAIPIKEVDETGGYTLSLSINDGQFYFELSKKS